MPSTEVKRCTRCGFPRKVNHSRADGLCASCDLVESRPPKRWLPDLDNEDTCPAGHWLVDHNVRTSPTGETICTACEAQETHAA